MADWKTEARNRAKSLKEGASFKITEGPNCFRLMPDKRGTKYAPYVEILVHRNVGPDEWFGRCGHELDGSGECYLCDEKIPELESSKSPQKRAMADRIRPQEQMICQVSRVDPDTGAFSAPKPWWVSNAKSVKPLLLAKIGDLKFSYDDPKKGFNLNIERTGMGMKNTVYEPPVRDETPTEVPLEIIKQIKRWEEILPTYDAADMKAAFYGQPKPEAEEAAPETEELEDGVGEAAPEEEEEQEQEESTEEIEAAEEPEESYEESAEEEVEVVAEGGEEESYEEPAEEEFEPEPAPAPRRTKSAPPKQVPPRPGVKPAPKPAGKPAAKPAPPAARPPAKPVGKPQPKHR